jgi:magnesium transporter
MMLVGTSDGVTNAEVPDSRGLRLASAHATAHVPVALPNQTAAQVRHELAGKAFDCADDVAVLDGRRLVGIVPIEVLIGAAPEALMVQLMDASPPVVAPGDNVESVVWRMVGKREASVAVVNGNGEFRGLVPPHSMLRVLLSEHDEDVARLGGYLAGTSDARHAAKEPVSKRLWHRLPWLLIGLIGAMLSTVIVGAFEDALEETVLLAVFVPAVVYMADAVGTQTEAVLIRGLSVGVSIRDVLAREIASGALIGLLIAAAFFPFALLVWGDGAVAIAVALALLASCSIATAVAMLLPWLFQRFGLDPAFGSGPLATVLQDLLSIAVYFAIAVPLAGG